jgi:hypothetical protein
MEGFGQAFKTSKTLQFFKISTELAGRRDLAKAQFYCSKDLQSSQQETFGSITTRVYALPSNKSSRHLSGLY